ncbi:putative Hydrolase [Streptomyces viridochromogenes Tue57]|uniref:Putative Hydrolase n=1 Tax=Streptomyces viridochromogenes Tue57 TaxID=1160705 RepID=L8PHZ1_STRVR|nr:putative Hydrolase [Streptomyces viridochromogenes Tue57]
MAAERLTYQDGLLEAELFEYGDDIRDVRGTRDIPRAALAGTVASLVDGDDPVSGAQVPGDGVPFTRVPGQPVQQDDRYPRSAPVTAGNTDALTDDGVL